MPEILFQELNKIQAMKGYKLLTKRNHVGRVCLVGTTKFFQNSCFEVAIGKNALYNSTTAQPTLNVVTEVTGEESLAYCQKDDSSVRNTIFSSILTSFRDLGLSISVSGVKLLRKTIHVVKEPSWARDLGFVKATLKWTKKHSS